VDLCLCGHIAAAQHPPFRATDVVCAAALP